MHKVFMKNIKTTKTTNFLMSALYVFGPFIIVSAFANKSKISYFLHQQITLWAAHFITVFNWVPSSACFSFQELSLSPFLFQGL